MKIYGAREADWCPLCLQSVIQAEASENRVGLQEKNKKLDEKQIPPHTHSGYLHDEQPSRLLGHPQAHGQADDQIQDQQQQIRKPSTRQENEASV